MRRLISSLLLIAIGVSGADLTGKWRAESTFPRGDKITEFFELRSAGSVLTGSFIDTFGGRHEIHDGKLLGEAISFWVQWEKDAKCNVTGVIRDGALELKLATPGATRTATARRMI